MSEITYAFPKLKNVDPSCYIDAYNLVLECSQAHSPRSFTVKLLDLLKKICPYDEAMAFFLDVNRKVTGEYTVNVERKWVDEYLNYYLPSEEYPQVISLYRQGTEAALSAKSNELIDWNDFPKCEFITDYIQGRGLRYSYGFSFFDLNGNNRAVIALDRTRSTPFSEIEQNRLKLALPILNNMYRNFYYQGTDNSTHMTQSSWNEYGFTKRETEIAELLCQGMTIQNISSALYIAVTTTYKHIAHIYEKTGVSSQQELLVKMLNRRSI